MPSGFCLEIISKKNGKIKGGSKSKVCPEQIEVASWKWGGVTGDNGVSAASASATNVTIHDVTVTCPMSVASSALLHAAATGDFIKTATLSGRTEGTNGEEVIYVQIRFNDVYISQYSISGTGADHPMDSITLSYAGVEILYRQQKPDGSKGQERMAAYDSATNAMVKPTLGTP